MTKMIIGAGVESIPNGGAYIRNGMFADVRTSWIVEYSLTDLLPVIARHECGRSIACKFDLYS